MREEKKIVFEGEVVVSASGSGDIEINLPTRGTGIKIPFLSLLGIIEILPPDAKQIIRERLRRVE